METAQTARDLARHKGGSATWLGIEFAARDGRVEGGEQNETRDKTADMRLPGDILVFIADRDGAESEQRIESHPDGQKGQEPRVAQGRKQRCGRHPVGRTVANALPP